MSNFQIGTAGLGVTFTGDMSNLQRTLDQGAASFDQFGSRASNAMKATAALGEDVARGFSRSAVSAAQMQAAMRGVPAQFTDIFVSLQSGQNPMTVFLQQGGQLKDMFGGIGPAAKAMGTYLAGLVNPFTVGAAAIAAAGVAAYQGAEEFQAFNRALILSGGTAGVTAGQLMDMASGIDAVNSSITQGRAAEALNAMVQAGVRGESQLRRYAQAAAEFEAAGGGAAAEVAKNFEALGRDPVAASAKLTQSMGYLTAATFEQIDSLVKQGKTVEAAKVAQEAYFSAITGRTPQLVQNLGSLETAWNAVANAAKKAWDGMLNVGRPASLADQVKAVEDRLAAARGHKTLGGGNGFDIPDPRTAADTALLESLREQQRLARRSVDLTSERVLREQAGVTWLQEGERLMTSQAKLAADIAKARQQGLAAGKSEAEIEQRVQAIRAAATKGGGRTTLKKDEFAEVFGRLSAKDVGLDSSFSKELNLLYQGYQRGRIGVEEYRAAVETLISTQRFAKDIESERLKAIRDEEAANKNAERSLEDQIRAAERAAQTARESANAMNTEVQTFGMGEQQLLELSQARLRDAAASLRQRAAVLENMEVSGRLSDAMRAEADALDDLAKSKNDLYNKKSILSADEAIAEAVRINGRVTDKLSTSLADSISDGILDGVRKGATIMDIFRSELRAQFARTVLRPIIQPVAEGMNTAIGAMMSGLLNAMGMGATSSGYNPGSDMGFSSTAWESYVASAKGNVFSGPGISAYSSQVVSQPTVFPFARGVGLMGEAGPEAIMPLRRGADGRLGVSAQGGGGNVTVNVINQSGQNVAVTGQRESTAADGSRLIDVFLGAAGEALSQRSGPLARGLEAGYGVRPAMA